MDSILKSTAMLKLIAFSLASIQTVSAANGCYYKNSNDGVQIALAQYPCSSNGGVQVCCNIGDTCGEDSICQKNAAFTLPAALTSTITSSSPGATLSQATIIATSSTTSAIVVTPTPGTLAQTTSHSVSSVAASATSYTVSSITLPFLSSIYIPEDLGLIHRRTTSDDGFYVGGCTDSSYSSSECSSHCTGYSLQNIVYSNSTSSWYCCGDTLAGCSAPTGETFDAVPPSAFDNISTISPAAASTIASSVIASASATRNNNAAPPKPSRLSPGAATGIAFGVAIPIIFILTATLGFCLRKRKLKAHQKAHVDRTLTDELAEGMRDTDSWYGGPTLRPDTSVPRTRAFRFFSHSNDSGGVDAPGHTFAYETPEGLKEVKLKAQKPATRKIPLKLHIPNLHLNIGNKRGIRNVLNRDSGGRLRSPQGSTFSPIRTRGVRGLEIVPEYETEERNTGNGGTATWPLPRTLQTPWEFQRSVVSLREMDGTGVNPLEQRQSGHLSLESDAEYETDVVNTDSSVTTDGSGWQVHRPWQIQKPPSLRGVDGTGKLQLPAW